MGVAMSITAFPVLIRILEDQKLLGTTIGTLAIACAAFNDGTGWLILAGITAVARAATLADAVRPFLGMVVYGVVMLGLVRPLLARAAQARRRNGRANIDNAVALIVLLISGAATEAIGVHALFGAFFAGVVMPRLESSERSFSAAIEPMTLVVLLPLFFAFNGLRTNVQLISGLDLWAQAALILAIATLGKGVGSALAARAMGASWPDASLIGILLNTRGLVELVVLNIGFDLGILSPVLFSMMVLMAIVTTVATSPLVSLVRRVTRHSQPVERVGAVTP